MTYTITIAEPTSIDAVGFRARRAGLEVRDCLLILEPDNQARLGLLAKRETASTVVEGYVRQETGVLDLDKSRINSVGDHKRPLQPTKNVRNVYGAQTAFMPTNAEGRFPANLILKHGITCHCEGTKKVKNPSGSVTGNEPSAVTKNAYGKFQGRTSFSSFGDEDGTEEVPNWICEQECPVALLDAQSGVLKSGSVKEHHMRNGKKGIFDDGLKPMPLMGYGDTGGASRFFKQVQEEGELDAYLNTLVREYPNE